MNWPDDSGRLEELRALGEPRLLLVGADAAAPEPVDPLEDWIRLPAREDELEVRVATLARREKALTAHPTVDADGLIWYRGQWIALSLIEHALVAALVDRFGTTVSHEALLWRAWTGRQLTCNALYVHMRRVRRRIAVLGLEVRTVCGTWLPTAERRRRRLTPFRTMDVGISSPRHSHRARRSEDRC